MLHATTKMDEALNKLHERRRQLHDWVQIEDTSREGAHEWKAEVLKGRLQEIEWAIEVAEAARA